MNKNSLKIVFMGTPAFAVASLKALIESGYNVVSVVTMPDKPIGRGHKMQFSAVKEYAQQANLPLLQPQDLKDEQFINALQTLNADLFIVVAFRILPETVFSMPRLGTFNLHASLLPQYRGAAPINWAIINGEKQTGVTTFFLEKTVDTGNIILQEKTQIGDNETFGELYDRLKEIGAKTLLKTTELILQHADNQDVPVQRQAFCETLLSAPKIFKETCEINFSQTAQAICNFVRGLCPIPCAWANITIKNKLFENVKIYKVSMGKGLISVPCADGFVSIDELQLPNKKRMSAKEVFNGIQ